MQFSLTLPDPIFIIGAQRSGTTLLRLMLTAHPDICIPPESPFFVHLEQKYGSTVDLCNNVVAFLDDLYTDEKFREWNVNRTSLQRNLCKHNSLKYSDAISIVYQTNMQQFDSGARIWGDKNPDNIFHVDTILKYFPNAKLIHIVRDVRAVYNSVNTKAISQFGKRLRAQVLLVTKRWSQVVDIAEKYRHDKQFYTVYYEQLVSNPEEQLKGVCSWLGIDFNEQMLRFYQENAKKLLVPTHRLRWHQRTLQPVSGDRIDAWMDELSISEIEALEFMNRKKMNKLGYPCVTNPWRYRGLLKLLSEYIGQIFFTKWQFMHKYFNVISQMWAKMVKHNPQVALHPDDVFIVSYPKSGNTWVRFLLANIIRYDSGEPVDFHSVHQVIPDIEVKAHEKILHTMPPPRLIKSHEPYDSRFKRVIYILRDGRDVMVSYYYHLHEQGQFEGSFLDFLRKDDLHPCLWHEHVESWLPHTKQCELLLIRYEGLIKQPEIELEKMCGFAGLPCDRDRLRWAVSNSSFDAMRKIEREKGRAFGKTQGFEFVRKGVVGDWQNHFDSAHKAVFKSYANQMLLRLGYVDSEDW